MAERAKYCLLLKKVGTSRGLSLQKIFGLFYTKKSLTERPFCVRIKLLKNGGEKMTRERTGDVKFSSEHEYWLAERRQLVYIEQLRAKGHPLLRKKWGANDEMEALIQIIRHQMMSGLESIEQIRSMLLRSGIKKKVIKKILRVAKAA